MDWHRLNQLIFNGDKLDAPSILFFGAFAAFIGGMIWRDRRRTNRKRRPPALPLKAEDLDQGAA